jgi:hypothetical protein
MMSEHVSVKLTRVELVLRPLKRVRLISWSGVYAGKLVYDAFTRAGCVVDRGGFFRVTPIWSRTGVIAGASLVPEELYTFTTYIWGAGQQEYTLCLIQGLQDVKAPIELVEAKVTEQRLELAVPREPEAASEEVVAAIYRVHHLPTFYRFHGAVIAYPSPRRMLASAARRVAEALENPDPEAANILRKAVKELAEHVELYNDQTRRQRIVISHGKEQPVFHGYAEYYIVASKPLANLFNQLLEASKHLGLGGSPGLGLGHVNTVQQRKPRHQPPPPARAAQTLENSIED